MPRVCVYLFGYPRVEVDGTPVVVPRRKAMALLAYLSVSQSHQSRDVVASLLWPEEETSRGYAFLRNALWVLHQTPLDPWVLSTRHTVGIQPSDELWVDVAEFRRLVRCCEGDWGPDLELPRENLAALQSAADLARDAFLSGFVVEDSRTFEDWQSAEANALAQELAHVFEQLSDHHERVGDTAAALRSAQRLRSARPLDESAYRRVMRLQAQTGDRAAALSTFDECTRMLERELGLAPSDATQAVADGIRSLGAPAARPAPRRTDRAPRLVRPRYALPTVGREDDVARVLALFSEKACRLVTVTGAGGAGKTRFAVEVAERATMFPEGSAFVSLVDVESPALVPAAILTALGEVGRDRMATRHAAGADPALRDVAQHLTDREMLVVLDNAEHLARDVRWLDSLVRVTRDPRFLVTSRQAMGTADETVYALAGLALTSAPEMPSAAVQSPAVQLFLQAARRADSRFAPSADDVEAISALVRHLGGNPLAIELAASWVRTLSPTAIAREISKSVDFLKTDGQHIAPRHRSLRAAFEGSWGLLDRSGRSAFRALSVFRGGFTAESALRIADVALPTLATLVSKSLLGRPSADRYEMLEVVRQYARERLLALPDEARDRLDRHAEHFLALLAGEETRLKGTEQAQAIERLARDEANLAAAWRHAAARSMTPALTRAAMGLFLFCDMSSRFAEGRELFRLAAESESGETEDAARRRAYLGGFEAWFTGFVDPPTAIALFQRALAEAADLPLDRDLGFIRVLAAYSRWRLGIDFQPGIRDAMAFFDTYDHAWENAAAHEASIGPDDGLDRALALVRESIAIRERIGDRWGVALARHTEATLLEKAGDADGAICGLTASATLRRELGLDSAGLAFCHTGLGRLKALLGLKKEARRDLEEAERLATRIGYPFAAAVALEELVGLDVAEGKTALATRHARAAAAAYRAAGDPHLAAEIERRAQTPAARPPRRGASE